MAHGTRLGYVLCSHRLCSTPKRSLPVVTCAFRKNSRHLSILSTSSRLSKLDYSHPIEEETTRDYKAEHYYPVRIGQVFNDCYKVTGKLGYGSASTVWLCRDLRTESEYVALKVYTNTGAAHRELSIYEHINSHQLEHGGREHVRKMLENFEVEGPHGKHTCLVHQPLGMTFSELKELTPDGVFGVDLIRQTIRHIIAGLDFLHEAHVIHTDLQPNNMLVGINDPAVFAKFEQFEAESPIPRKELHDRTIYMSRPMPFSKGLPVLSDLSEARLGDAQNTGLIMPNVYRAPEVILKMPWSYPVDIWGLGMVIWDLFAGNPLFKPKDQNNTYSESIHLAQMIAILGPPPLDFLSRSKASENFWHQDGTWKNTVPIPNTSLETSEIRLQGEEKELFLVFMRKMLQWKPEDRGNCKEVFFDEWLLADLIESGEIVRDE